MSTYFDRWEHNGWPKMYKVMNGNWEHLHSVFSFNDDGVALT